MSCPIEIQSELERRGLIPQGLTCKTAKNEIGGKILDVDCNGRVLAWQEPIPGRKHFMFGGFMPPEPLDENQGLMVEIAYADGMEWHMTRIVHAHPSRCGNDLYCNVDDLMINEQIKLSIIEDLPWDEHGGREGTFCIMGHTMPISFTDFRKTFRYWLICNSLHGGRLNRSWRITIPSPLVQPSQSFFDFIHSPNERCVRIGLIGGKALDTDKDWMLQSSFNTNLDMRATFEYLWSQYITFRKDIIWKTFRKGFYTVKFIARLKCWRADRPRYAPGGDKFNEAVEECTCLGNPIAQLFKAPGQLHVTDE